MRSRSAPRRLRDGPRIILGAVSFVGWVGAAVFLFDSIADAGRTTAAWFRRESTIGDVARAWLTVPVAVVGFLLATLLSPLLIVRGVVSLRALLKQRERALELRRAAGRGASAHAVFVSYRTVRHASDAQAVARALQEAEQPAWLDAERGTLPTHLFFVDRVLEDAVRSARAVVVLHQAGDEEGEYEETRLDRIDLALASAVRWAVFAPFAVIGAICAPLLWPLFPLIAGAEPPSLVVPPSVRGWWYRSLSGADIRRRSGERWQAWEQRLAALNGLPTVTVAVVDDAGEARPDADVVLARGTLGCDVRERLLPALTAAQPDPTAPLALAHAQVAAARATARAHPFRTLWRAWGGPAEGEPALAALMRRVGGEGDTARAFTADGYAVLGRFLDRDEVLAVRTEVARAFAAPRDPSDSTLVPLRWDAPVVDRVVGDEPRRRRLAAVTGGDDLRWVSGSLAAAAPGGPDQGWTQDWWCWDHPISNEPRAAQVAVLCNLASTDEETGAPRVLPGSHREQARDRVHPATSEAVTLHLAAGDAVVFDCRLLRGTHSGRGAARPECVLLSFTPSWRTLPAEIREHLLRDPGLAGDGDAADRPWLPGG